MSVRRIEVPEASAAAMIRAISTDPAVSFVEKDARATISLEPNDPLYPNGYQPGFVWIGAPAAWDTSTGASGPVIAVVDTGVDAAHPDLGGRVLAGYDFVNNDNDPSDDNGHGTHVAGIAAATGNNGIGVAGVCWGCSILPVKVLDSSGQGWYSTVAAGITWAADHGASIINLSLGGTSNSDTLAQAVAYAQSKGIAIVAAAGNAGTTQPFYPASLPGVIAVAAEWNDHFDGTGNALLYDWSDYGADWVSVAAPGCTESTWPGNSYASECGTSMATPFVSGSIGLLMAADPAASPSEAATALLGTAGPELRDVTADGDIHLDVALSALLSGDVPPPVPMPTPTPSPTATPTSSPTTSPSPKPSPTPTFSPTPSPTPVPTPTPTPSPTPTPTPLPAPSPTPTPGPSGPPPVTRLAGASRYETSAAISAASFGSHVAVMYVASGAAFPDALSAASVAGRDGAPLLLVAPTSISPAVQAEITRLHPARIIIVGGTGAISSQVAARLGAIAPVTRLAGASRYETSAAISAASFGSHVAVMYVASGAAFPDALSAASVAGRDGAPLLLVAPTSISPAVQAEITRLHPARIIIVGGTGAISSQVAARLGAIAPVTRLAGASRYETSAAISAASFGSHVAVMYVASGAAFPDALSAASVAGRDGAPLLLVAPTSISPAVQAEITRLHPARIIIVGGTGAISSQVAARLAR